MKEKEKRRGRERGDQAKIKRYGTLIFGMETKIMNGFYEIRYEFPCFDGYPLAQI